MSETKEDKKFYRLMVRERLALLSFLPQEKRKFTVLLTSENLRDKVQIGEEDQKQLEWQVDGVPPQQNIRWNNTKDFGKIIEITDDERVLVNQLLADLEKEELLASMHLTLYQHFVLGKNMIDELTEEEAEVAGSSGTLLQMPPKDSKPS